MARGGRRSAEARAAIAAGIEAARERGARLGRPATPVPVAADRVAVLRSEGKSLSQIAEQLNDENVPSASGRPWTKSTVQYVLRRLQSEPDSPQCPAPGQAPGAR
ncbi:recombinase family protein [Hamadaea tsunoensis]|uniref:recombinase family protein n=1 Tax=Hamadaea tsunoensis TaxID=53368 RepID=UPI003898ED43